MCFQNLVYIGDFYQKKRLAGTRVMAAVVRISTSLSGCNTRTCCKVWDSQLRIHLPFRFFQSLPFFSFAPRLLKRAWMVFSNFQINIINLMHSLTVTTTVAILDRPQTMKVNNDTSTIVKFLNQETIRSVKGGWDWLIFFHRQNATKLLYAVSNCSAKGPGPKYRRSIRSILRLRPQHPWPRRMAFCKLGWWVRKWGAPTRKSKSDANIKICINEPPLQVKSMPRFTACITHHFKQLGWNAFMFSNGPQKVANVFSKDVGLEFKFYKWKICLRYHSIFTSSRNLHMEKTWKNKMHLESRRSYIGSSLGDCGLQTFGVNTLRAPTGIHFRLVHQYCDKDS